MYRAHSKDINRNKSFHPLTYGNLRRVELLKEAEDEKKQRAADRQKELRRDQEERRYDELVLTSSADSLSGEMASFRRIKNIFKAEYEAESAKQHSGVKEEGNGATDGPLSSSTSASPLTASSNAFLSKFKKGSHLDPSTNSVNSEMKAEEPCDELGVVHRKRPREVEDQSKKESGNAENNSKDVKGDGSTTGFVTSAEAAQLRKELNLAQKQRHDPLLRVRQYQNSCVANAARQQRHQQHDSGKAAGHDQKDRTDNTGKDNSDALQSRIRELLALKTKK